MMKFEKLSIYHAARELYCLADEIVKALPDQHADIGEILQNHASTAALKIARGTAAVSRADAYRSFRICKRSAELCHSILERLVLAKLADRATLAAALELSSDIQTRAQTIIERIEQKLPPKEVFRD